MSSVDFDLLVVVQELEKGQALAYSLVEPELAAYGRQGQVREDLRRGLAVHLEGLEAAELGRFLLSEGELRFLSITLPTTSSKRLRTAAELTLELPCWVVPERRDAWLRPLTLSSSLSRMTLFVRHDEDPAGRLEEELRRAVTALGTGSRLCLDLIPRGPVQVETLTVSVPRQDLWAEEAGSQKLAARQKNARKNQARDLLSSVGRWLEPRRLPAGAPDLEPRREERRKLSALLGADRRGSVLVVGEPGVGKTWLIESMVDASRPILATSGTEIVAGQSMFGQVEERMLDVLAAAELLDATLYFDTLEELVTDQSGGTELVSLLRPWMERGRVRLLAEVDADRLDALLRNQASFFSLLTQVRVPALSVPATEGILWRRSEARAIQPARQPSAEGGGPGALRSGAPARFADRPAVATLVQLVTRYFPYHRLPGSALRVADELAAGGPSEISETGEKRAVPLDSDAVHRGVSALTGIPEMLLRDQEPLKLERLRAGLRRRLIGQEASVERLAHALCAVKARLQPEGRPLSVLLFIGPTGVGKTQAARALAGLLYGSVDRLVRFDMSEYADSGSADRLIRGRGDEEGLLTRRLRREPFSVLLLDEIEKADPAVFDLLLQVFGEGRLSDAKGRTAYFHNCLIILTSNLGASERRSAAPGFVSANAGKDSSRAFYDRQIEMHFRPELINRLDKVIAFESLTPEELTRVTELQLADLARRQGFEERGLRFEPAPEVIRTLAQSSWSPAHGARALRRHVQRRLVNPLSIWLSETADIARNGTLHVLSKKSPETREPGASAPSPANVLSHETEDFRFELHRSPARKSKDRRHRLDQLMDLRRTVREALDGGRVEELGDRIQYLQQQLYRQAGHENERKAFDSGRASMLAELHRLSAVWGPIIELRDEVQLLEEAALGAYVAGESPAEWLKPVPELRRRWYRRLPDAHFAIDPPRNTVTLWLRELDSGRAMTPWLQGLVGKAPDLGWTISGAPVHEGQAAPFAGADDLLEEVRSTTRDFRACLVLAEGPNVGSWLAPEAGLHRFFGLDSGIQEPTHLRVRRAAFSALTPKQIDAVAALGKGPPPPLRRLAALPARRVFDFVHRRLQMEGLANVDLAKVDLTPDQYWPRYEMALVLELSRYDHADDRGLDRQKDFYSTVIATGSTDGEGNES